MSFSAFLLTEGVEMELPAALDRVLEVLESEVQAFAYEEHGYRLTPVRGVLGSEWRLVITLVGRDDAGPQGNPVGFMEVRRQEEGDGTVLRIPPRSESEEAMVRADPDGAFYAAFIFHLLNAFQRRALLDIPGTLPVR